MNTLMSEAFGDAHRTATVGSRGSVGSVGAFQAGWIARRARVFRRRIERARPWPAGLGSLLAISFLTFAWGAGAVQGGHGPAMLGGTAQAIGLTAETVSISGQVETSEADVSRALALGSSGSLVGFDADEARVRLLALPWVRDVAIRKLFPGRLDIMLVERRPMAVWQHGDRLTVVEASGKRITDFGIAELIENRFSHLPHLVGEGAAQNAGEVLSAVSPYPHIAERVRAYVRVGSRRWRVAFANGIVVDLPEDGAARAMVELAALQSKHAILDRQLAAIDLRVAGRAALRLLPEAAEERAKFVSERAKAMKKIERENRT